MMRYGIIWALNIVITLHIGNVHLLDTNSACADVNNIKAETFFYIQVLLLQVPDINLNKEVVEFWGNTCLF
jgi:hypothetical protein